MLNLTARELEFLACSKTGWRRRYWNEFARLLKEGDNARDARNESRAHKGRGAVEWKEAAE
jgi:hypothetical protein